MSSDRGACRAGVFRAALDLPVQASGNRTLGGLHLLSVLGPLLRFAR